MTRADTREPKTRTEPLRRAGWEITALHYGDFDGHDAVGKLWAIEHKTLSKMIADMQNGVLIRQCKALVEHCDFPILMVEGHWVQQDGSLLGTGVTWEQAWNQLQTIQDIGCRLQLTSSTPHSVERLFELEAYYKKEKHDSAMRHLSSNPFVAALSLIDGIDEVKAKAVEAVYPTLEQVARLNLEELQEARGVGEVLAKRIYTFFHTNYTAKDLELWS